MESFSATLEPDPSLLRELRGWLRNWLLSAEVTQARQDAVVLAAHEAVANAIEHAEPKGPVAIEGHIDQGAILIEVSHHGRWRTHARPSDERGRGIPLIRAYMTEVEFLAERDRTRVRMRLSLP